LNADYTHVSPDRKRFVVKSDIMTRGTAILIVSTRHVENHGVIVVEFFGIPRQRAGRAEMVVQAGTVAEAMAAVKRACPGLFDLLEPDGGLASHYLVSIDGKDFAKEMRQPLQPGSRLLVLSADVGG
jgi:hypothetical protein